MNLRQLKKQDKRAAALLIAIRNYQPSAFGLTEDGRYEYEWRCSYEYDEWDCRPAWEEWTDGRFWDHPNACGWYGFNPATGNDIPKALRPRPMSRRESRAWYALRAPDGFRQRGNRIVRVGLMGEMVKPHTGRKR